MASEAGDIKCHRFSVEREIVFVVCSQNASQT